MTAAATSRPRVPRASSSSEAAAAAVARLDDIAHTLRRGKRRVSPRINPIRRILACGDPRPERVELDARVRRTEERDECGEVAQAVRLGVHLHRRIAPSSDEEWRRDAGVRARIALRVDALQPAEGDAVHPCAEIRPVDELALLDRELREVRVVDDDRRVRSEEEQADEHHCRVPAAGAEDQNGKACKRKERVRRPEQSEIRTDRAHASSLEARSTGPISNRRSTS